MKLYMSIGLAVLLFAQIILFLMLKPEASGMIVVIFGLIMVMAVIAVYANYMQLKRIEKRVAELPKDYRDFYVDANEAVGISSMSRGNKKNIMAMILEILEHSYLDGKPLSDVVGDNQGDYIKGFIRASGGSMSLLYLFGYGLCNFMIYLFFMKVYMVVKAGGVSLEILRERTLDVGIVFAYAFIAFIFLPWLLMVMQKAAAENWSGGKRLWILVPFSIPLVIMSLLIFIENDSWRKFLDQPLPIFSSYGSIMVAILVFGCSLGLCALARHLQIKKQLSEMI